MKKLTSLSLFLLFGVFDYAIAQVALAPVQSDTAKTAEAEILTFPEEMPQFDGDIHTYLAKGLKYPNKAKEMKIQGRVIAQFVVTEEGKVTQIEILRSPDILLSNEVIRLIETMPLWKPGSQNGKPVKVRYTLPVSFKL